MALPKQPTSVIFPLVKSTKSLKLGRGFLGTGFMVGQERFITAKHCLENVTLADDEVFAAVFGLHGREPYACAISDVVLDERFDVAHGSVHGREDGAEFLSIVTDDALFYNADVLTVEYSGTQDNVTLDDGRSALVFSPYFRKGNMVSAETATLGHKFPTNCVELSFPALKGASGAPVVYEKSGLVVGMIVANVEHQLMPAQIETIHRTDGEVDSTIRYFLPVGQAIRSEYLQPHLDVGDRK